MKKVFHLYMKRELSEKRLYFIKETLTSFPITVGDKISINPNEHYSEADITVDDIVYFEHSDVLHIEMSNKEGWGLTKDELIDNIEHWGFSFVNEVI